MVEILIKSIDVHQGNVIGLGAEKFADGLTKQIVDAEHIEIQNLYINKKTPLKDFYKSAVSIVLVKYVFGIFSRFIEIIFWRFFRNHHNEIIVLGDLPLNTPSKQYVLCHQSLMFKTFPLLSLNFFQFLLFRVIFKIFLKKDDVILVQSEEMAEKTIRTFGQKINVKVVDITSQFFGWPEFRRTERHRLSSSSERLRLFYPSAFYPHKNHHMLDAHRLPDATDVLVTISEDCLPRCKNSVTFLGNISREDVYDIYREVDAILFLSGNESLGLPILEAVRCNLPIICPAAEYSINLASENCFYFDLNDPDSLINAINSLKLKVLSGWWPNWDFESVYQDSDSMPIEKIILSQ